MIRIHLTTGTAWTNAIEVDGSLQDDILQLIDNYYYENGTLPVKMYTMEELEEIYDEDEINDQLEQMLPINGGEFWIDGISNIEEM